MENLVQLNNCKKITEEYKIIFKADINIDIDNINELLFIHGKKIIEQSLGSMLIETIKNTKMK